MFIIKTREYLGQLKNIDREIRDKQLLAQRYRDNAVSVSPKLTDVKVQSSGVPDKMAESITKALDYEAEANDDVVRLIELKHHIEEQIDGMREADGNYGKTYYNILMGSYVHNMNVTALSRYIGYSPKQTRRLFDKSIKVFEVMYGEEYL